MNICYIKLLLIFIISYYENDVIVWKKDKKLSWENFKGIPDKTSQAAAATDSKIEFEWYFKKDTVIFIEKAVFDETRSWVNKAYKSLRILAHEQIHFDITELIARKERQRLTNLKIRSKEFEDTLKKLEVLATKELIHYQDSYDFETNHSRNLDKQLFWSNKVAEELSALDTYSHTVVKVILTN